MFRKTLKDEEEGDGGGAAPPPPVMPAADPRITPAFAPNAHVLPPTQRDDAGSASISSALAELSVAPSHKMSAKSPSRSQAAARSAHKQASPAPPAASAAPSPFASFAPAALPPVPAPLFTFNLSSMDSPPPPTLSMLAAPTPAPPSSPFALAAAAGQPVGLPPLPVQIPMFAPQAHNLPKRGPEPKPEPAPKLEERRVLRVARAKPTPLEVTKQRCESI